MDGFTFNKIAGAVLGTILFGFFVVEVSHRLYPNPRHGAHVEEMGYAVPGMEHGDGHGDAQGNGGETTDTPAVDLPALLASADTDAGAAQFRACGACHNNAAGAGAKVGPNLWGVVGRPIGSVEGFNYSRAVADHGGTWTFENLFHFLEAPSTFIPGTSMSYRGMRRDGDRANLIAYLRTLSDNPIALPSAAAPAMDSHSDVMTDEAEAAGDAASEAMEGPAEDMSHDEGGSH